MTIIYKLLGTIVVTSYYAGIFLAVTSLGASVAATVIWASLLGSVCVLSLLLVWSLD